MHLDSGHCARQSGCPHSIKHWIDHPAPHAQRRNADIHTLFILNDAKQEGRAVRVFLMGDAVACAKAGQKVPAGYYNAADMVRMLECDVRLCDTCMDARGLRDEELVDSARRGTLQMLADWSAGADKVLVF